MDSACTSSVCAIAYRILLAAGYLASPALRNNVRVAFWAKVANRDVRPPPFSRNRSSHRTARISPSVYWLRSLMRYGSKSM